MTIRLQGIHTLAGSCGTGLLSGRLLCTACLGGPTALQPNHYFRDLPLPDRWLNPFEWLDEPVPGYTKHPVARDEVAATELKTRTLANLYNECPKWLADAHSVLDSAVATAYGWDAEISEKEALSDLLTLNPVTGK